MKKNWKLLMLGVTAIFLMQSCVVVRKARPHRHHHHRHCMVPCQQTTDAASFNVSVVYMATENSTSYELKG